MLVDFDFMKPLNSAGNKEVLNEVVLWLAAQLVPQAPSRSRKGIALPRCSGHRYQQGGARDPSHAALQGQLRPVAKPCVGNGHGELWSSAVTKLRALRQRAAHEVVRSCY